VEASRFRTARVLRYLRRPVLEPVREAAGLA